jgi:signal transduction histidine kinase
MTTLATTSQVRPPIPRWMWLAAGAVVALGTLYLALYPLTLAWPAAVYLAIGQLHTVAFAVSTILLARLSRSLPERGGRWAASVLLLSSLLAIGLDVWQRAQGREITAPSGIIVYVLVYLLNVVAVNCVFPRHQWHWRMALRRFSEVGIIMCVVYAGLQFTLPRLIPDWSWSPELTLACFRFVSTVGLATSALIIYRRYFVAGRPALVWGAIGLGCMLITDLLIFVMTDVIARGGSARLMAVASPIWVIQHGCWLVALVQLRQSPLVWRDDATVQLPQSPWVWVRSTRSGLILIGLAMMVSQDTGGTLWIWFVVALVGREIIVAYERDVAAERQAASQRDLEQAHERIRHLLALRTAHVKGATHDLSHGIVTFYVTTEGLLQELAAHGMEPDQVCEHRARVRSGIDLYKAMVQDLHDAALLEQDALKLQLALVDMRQVIRAMTQQLQPRFQQQECQLTLRVPETPVWAKVDETRIERVVMNLLLNALNAIDHDAGAVTIALSVETDVIVEVRDNGCGMDENQLAVIRDRFAAIEQGEIPDSTGIGLNLCKRLIDAHGGRFTLRSVLGAGTTVTFALGRSPGPPETATPDRHATRGPI